MSLSIYNNLKKTMFNEALLFISTKYALCEEGQEEETIKGLWVDFKKYEQEKGVNKVSKKKAVVPEEDRCTHLKADGSRCSMRKCSEAVMKKHPEYNEDHCATHNRNDLTPKKGKTTKAKKFVCGHTKGNGDKCQTKVLKEGDKCKVYKNMMLNRALKKDAEQSEEEKTPTKKTSIKKKTPTKVEEEYEGDTEEIEEGDNEEESEEESAKSAKKRVVVESDDEEE